jgi:membrane protein YqaA with SNARE-associated domain
MRSFVHWIRTFAVALGAPGLFLVSFLDSSVLSLPEIADLLVIYMVTQHKARLLLYVVSATAGSVAGCLILYYLGRKGGEALMRKRFHAASVDRTLGAFRRHGVMAVLIPSILPPPAPFKIFVLLAGVAEISVARFTAAIAIGRGARYMAEGLLAVWYGDRALAYIHAHGKEASLIVVGLLAAGLVAYLLWNRHASRIMGPSQP